MRNETRVQCLIITLCKSLNYGAYLQAFALKEVLSNRGYQVSCLDVYDMANEKKRLKGLYRGWKRRPFSIVFNTAKLMVFKLAEKKLNIAQFSESSSAKIAYIGADEIWSVKNGSFDPAPEFFGLELDGLVKASYAPSVGNSGLEDIIRYPDYVRGLSNLDAISVRDSESLKVATEVTGRQDATLVLDPTLLHDFSKHEIPIKIKSDFVLVYTYGFSSELAKEVRKFAKRNNVVVISAGFYHSWADKNVACSPFQFLSLMKAAKYVITDTFHGSIFAIKYRKNFICYGQHKKKVKHLFELLGLNEALVSPGYLSEGRDIKSDYSGLEDRLLPLVKQSFDYLDRCDLIVKERLQDISVSELKEQKVPASNAAR